LLRVGVVRELMSEPALTFARDGRLRKSVDAQSNTRTIVNDSGARKWRVIQHAEYQEQVDAEVM